MRRRSTFSLIVPTRSRPAQLRQFLDSAAATARYPERIEVVLVVDEDDLATLAIREHRLALRQVVVPPGQTMGALNSAGYAASAGDYIMLLNDDVIVRTRGWDEIVLASFGRFPDPYVLVHVNDTLMRDHLCTFPLVSRAFCELAGGICPREYNRYRIDDHIEDPFNLLAALGVRRTIYLPDVIFEHTNAVEHPQAGRIYISDPAILALDAPLFEAMFPARKELALRMLDQIEGGSDPAITADRQKFLNAIADPFSIRIAGRQCIVRKPWWKRSHRLAGRVARFTARMIDRFRKGGCRGVAKAIVRRLFRMR